MKPMPRKGTETRRKYIFIHRNWMKPMPRKGTETEEYNTMLTDIIDETHAP